MGQRGRPPALGEPQVRLVEQLYLEERLTVREIADYIGVSHMTVWRALRQIGEADAWN